MLGFITDCYQPTERGLTRRTKYGLRATRFSIFTKEAKLEHDLDLLVPLTQQKRMAVHVTLTTLPPELAHRLRQRTAALPHRLRLLRLCAKQVCRWTTAWRHCLRRGCSWHFPDRAQRVLARARGLHGISAQGQADGKVYQSQFGSVCVAPVPGPLCRRSVLP